MYEVIYDLCNVMYEVCSIDMFWALQCFAGAPCQRWRWCNSTGGGGHGSLQDPFRLQVPLWCEAAGLNRNIQDKTVRWSLFELSNRIHTDSLMFIHDSCQCLSAVPCLRNDTIKAKILKVVQEVYGGADVKYSEAWQRSFVLRGIAIPTPVDSVFQALTAL